MQKLKLNDLVQILSGKDKGKQGKIKKINFKTNRVTVEGTNLYKKALRPNQANQQGGIVEIEKALHISNISLVDPKSGKPCRIKIKQEDGANIIRVSKKTLSEIK